jgi:hypothetical protein
MADEMSVQQAEEILRNLTVEYHFLTENKKPWWSVAEVAKGLSIPPDVVLSWCENQEAGVMGVVRAADTNEWRLPRDPLVLFLAKLVSL